MRKDEELHPLLFPSDSVNNTVNNSEITALKACLTFLGTSSLYLHYYEVNFQFPDSASSQIYYSVFYPTFADWPVHVALPGAFSSPG